MPNSWTEPDAALVAETQGLTPGRALDVGCAGGHDSIWLAQQGWAVTAIDTSRHAISKLRKLAQEPRLDIKAVKQDVTTLEMPNEFDLVSICYMHLPGRARAKMITNAACAVAPGGTLLFRSFEATLEEAPFARELLPSREEVLEELGTDLAVKRAEVESEYFPYMKKEMKLLTVVAIHCM